MSDFFREVDEDYRRERAAALFRRFQVPLLLLVVAIVIVAGGWRWYHDRQIGRAEAADARYEAAAADVRRGQDASAQTTYAKLAGSDVAGYALLSRLRAAELQGLHDPNGAAKALDAIASDEGNGAPAFRDLARYRGALLRVGTEDPAAFEREYGRFSVENFTFRDNMRELLALAALKRSDRAAAEKYLDEIIVDPFTPPALRSRAQAFRELANAGPATKLASAPPPATVTSVTPDPSPAASPAAPAASPTAPASLPAGPSAPAH